MKVREIAKRGKTRFEVDFGEDSTGYKKRLLFETEAAANAEVKRYKSEAKSRGEWWARLPESDRKTVEVVYKEAKADGRTLLDLWADHKRWRKDNAQSAVTPTAYEDAVSEWKERKVKAGKSQDYVDEAASVLLKFGLGRERQHMHEIAAGELQTWINAQTTWGLSSKKTNTSLFSSLWTVGLAMGWCSINIVDRLEPIQRPGADVKIYDNSDTLNIMAGAMYSALTQLVIAPLSLGFFSCMRPEEVTEPPEDPSLPPFSWDDIGLEHGRITVRPEIAKVGDQRTIRLQPTAVLWLKLAKELKNPLPPVNERRLVDAVCELIGLSHWIRDGLRKSCATHLRSIYRNDYEVVLDMGHSVRVLLKHYAQLQTPSEVSRGHWQITPKMVEKHLKSDAWKKILEHGAKIAEERRKREAEEKATIEAAEKVKASAAPRGQTANANASTVS